MTDTDDMMRAMEPREPSELDKWLERERRDDSVERRIARIRARNQALRRMLGLPERSYPPLADDERLNPPAA
jgi:hypothetical protein